MFATVSFCHLSCLQRSFCTLSYWNNQSRLDSRGFLPVEVVDYQGLIVQKTFCLPTTLYNEAGGFDLFKSTNSASLIYNTFKDGLKVGNMIKFVYWFLLKEYIVVFWQGYNCFCFPNKATSLCR